MTRRPESLPCPVPGHVYSTCVETRGLGGFQPVEVYQCDGTPGAPCTHRSEIRPTHEAEDCGFAPEENDD